MYRRLHYAGYSCCGASRVGVSSMHRMGGGGGGRGEVRGWGGMYAMLKPR